MDGCTRCSCCSKWAKEFVIPKEVAIILTITRVQNKTAKKLPIFFLLPILSIVVIELNIPILGLYASGIIQFNKTLRTSRILYKLVDKSHEWDACPYLNIGSLIYLVTHFCDTYLNVYYIIGHIKRLQGFLFR